MKDSERFEAIANQHQRDADASTLDNARERCLRSQRAWAKMAVRAREVEANREKKERAAADALAGDGSGLVTMEIDRPD